MVFADSNRVWYSYWVYDARYDWRVNRMQGRCFSDHVNLTARLEGLTKYYGSDYN